MAKHDHMPKFQELMNPLLQALHELGGSGSIGEIFTRVSEILELSEEILSTPHDPERSSQSEVEYRLAWARTYLKNFGLIDNSERGVWVIIPDKKDIIKVDPRAVVRKVREMDLTGPTAQTAHDQIDEPQNSAVVWRVELFQVLRRR